MGNSHPNPDKSGPRPDQPCLQRELMCAQSRLQCHLGQGQAPPQLRGPYLRTVGWCRSAEAQASSLDVQDAGGLAAAAAAGCQLKLWPWGFSSEPSSIQPKQTCATGVLTCHGVEEAAAVSCPGSRAHRWIRLLAARHVPASVPSRGGRAHPQKPEQGRLAGQGDTLPRQGDGLPSHLSGAVNPGTLSLPPAGPRGCSPMAAKLEC